MKLCERLEKSDMSDVAVKLYTVALNMPGGSKEHEVRYACFMRKAECEMGRGMYGECVGTLQRYLKEMPK
jgi:hypothetical protein